MLTASLGRSRAKLRLCGLCVATALVTGTGYPLVAVALPVPAGLGRRAPQRQAVLVIQVQLPR